MPALVQAKIASVGASSCAIAYTSNVTAGNMLTVEVSDYSSSTPVTVVGSCVTQTAGTATLGTITLDSTAAQAQSGNCGNASLFSIPVIGSGSCTLQFSLASVGFITMNISEWSGLSTNAREAQHGASSVTNDAGGSSGNATSAAAALFVGVMGNCAHATLTLTGPSGWTIINSQPLGGSWVPEGSAYRVVSSSTTDANAWSWTGGTGPWCMVVGVYPAASGAAFPSMPMRISNRMVGPNSLRYFFRQPTVAWWNSKGALTQVLTLSATSAVTASFVKSALKTLTAVAVAITASAVRSVGKTLSASSAATASTIKSVGKALTATVVVTTATIIKSVGKILSTSSAATASITKSVSKILNTTAVAMTASMARSVGKLLTSTAVILGASLTAIKAKLVTMTAAVSVTASLVATFIAGAAVVIADYIPIFRSRRR